jgi:hypothetical protein
MWVTASCVGSAAGLLSTLNPDIFTIRSFGVGKVPGVDAKESIHIGVCLGAVLSLGVGVGGTLVSRSWWPLFGTVLALIALGSAYQWALKHPYQQSG